jgi:tellurium resistance protein TerZ
MSLNNKTGVNLEKGSSVSLKKAGTKLEKVYVGLNWGSMEKKFFFGMLKGSQAVDLDGSATLFSANNTALETVYYNHLRSSDASIRHSGDDLTGDIGGDDGLDNEVLEINFSRVSQQVQQIVVFLNSFANQDFASIPYSKIRVFEKNADDGKDVFATFSLSCDNSFTGKVAMIMGKFVRVDDTWEFKAIGEAATTRKITDTIEEIREKYL